MSKKKLRTIHDAIEYIKVKYRDKSESMSSNDITFCGTEDCPRRSTCHRAKFPQHINMYVSMSNFNKEDCDYYLPEE